MRRALTIPVLALLVALPTAPAAYCQQAPADTPAPAAKQTPDTAAKTKADAGAKKAADEQAVAKKAAEQVAAEKKAAEKRAAEKKAAEDKAAAKKAAEEQAAAKKAADKQAAEQKAAAKKAEKAAKSARSEKKSKAAPSAAFALESELIAQVPAVREALDAVNADPQNAETWHALGTVLATRGDFKDSERALEIATQRKGDDPDLWVDLGATRVRAGKTGSGISALKKALKIEPFHPLAHYNLGIAYQGKNSYNAAMKEFETALLLEPKLAESKTNPGALNNRMLPYVRLSVYQQTVGSAPALYTRDIKR